MLVAHAAGPRLGLLIAAISARSSRSPKKVHLHNGARARPPGVALGALRADVGVARYGPLPSSSLVALLPFYKFAFGLFRVVSIAFLLQGL